MGLSDFQKKKLGHVFEVFYDVNNDGQIDWQDFEVLITRVSDINGWEKKGDKYDNGRKVLENVWTGLQKFTAEAAEVSIDGWLSMWTSEVENIQASKSLPAWQIEYLNFFFDASDTSGDNVIDLEEYSKVYTQFGVTEENCKTAFNQITNNGTATLDKSLYAALWTDFISGNDESSNSTFLFGPLA